MKNFLYILLVLVFFNLSLATLYYLKVISHYGLSFFNNFFDSLITNLLLFIILAIYSFIYKKFMIRKFNYFMSMLLGLLVGLIICFILTKLIFEEYLFIILFMSFAFTFISYSIYFDSIKTKVFK